MSAPPADVEMTGEGEQQFRARFRATCLHKTQVLRGNARLERQVELADPTTGTPVPQEVADRGLGAHDNDPTLGAARVPLPPT